MLAEQNDAQAQGLLAYMYLNGEGTAKNGREAVKWYKKSAAGDFYFAHINLGNLYASGDFVPKSLMKASFHYKKCADLLGDADQGGLCHRKIGFALQNGWHGEPDHRNAKKYFQKSLQLGDDLSACFMSLMNAVEGNNSGELMWQNICASYKPDFKKIRDQSFAKASQSEQRRAQKMSSECVETNFENCGWTY